MSTMNFVLRFATTMSLGAGIALVALACATRVILWARPEGTAPRSPVRELLGASAGCGLVLMMVHLTALMLGRAGSLSAFAATTVLGGAAVALGWSPNAVPGDVKTNPLQQSSGWPAAGGRPLSHPRRLV